MVPDKLIFTSVTNFQKDVDALIEATVQKWGTVDALVNNAGINVPRLLVDPAGKEELTEEIWDKVFAVNVKVSSLRPGSRSSDVGEWKGGRSDQYVIRVRAGG